MDKRQGLVRQLSCKKSISDEDVFGNNTPPVHNFSRTSTPLKSTSPSIEDEESPSFSCSTQEIKDEVDVLWDWNSPQQKQKFKKQRKRLNLQSSHKVPFKRHPSNNQLKHDFDKLKEDLRALKDELAAPDHEESLILSPREEAEFKDTVMPNLSEIDILINKNEKPCDSDLEDIFNDSMDEQMIQFSQQVENELLRKNNFDNLKSNKQNNLESVKVGSKNGINSYNHNKNNSDCSAVTSNSIFANSSAQNYNNCIVSNSVVKVTKDTSILQNVRKLEDTTFDDSLEGVLSQIPDEELDQLTQVVDIKSCRIEVNELNKKASIFPRSYSENSVEDSNICTTGKMEFHRTQSFEICNGILSEEKLKEIEKKRMEAEAKLKSKRLQEFSDSPIKCSPEEIEKKRLQALAIREAKKHQEIIERKKQEALQRLAQSRKKNAISVKSSLTKKL